MYHRRNSVTMLQMLVFQRISITARDYKNSLTSYDVVTNSDGPSEWERTHNTGNILELADLSRAIENAPIFNVSTPEELASVVYYFNSNNASTLSESDTLLEFQIPDDDIDLEGLLAENQQNRPKTKKIASLAYILSSELSKNQFCLTFKQKNRPNS